MKDTIIVRGRGRPRITLDETIKKDLIDMVYDSTQWLHLIYVANPSCETSLGNLLLYWFFQFIYFSGEP